MNTDVTMAGTSLVGAKRYTPTAQALHWIVAALIFSTLPIAWVMVNMPKSAHALDWLFTLHESIGITILVLIAVRLAWRASHLPPPLPDGLARFEKIAAIATHWLLYVILIGMPVSGYILNAAGGYPVSYFGLFTLPGLPKNPVLADAATWIHVAIGQWLIYALVLLHVTATAWHVAVRRDGVLERMLPRQNEQN